MKLQEQDYREAFTMYCIERNLGKPLQMTVGEKYCSGYVRAKFAPKQAYFTQVRQVNTNLFYVCLASKDYEAKEVTNGLFKLPTP